MSLLFKGGDGLMTEDGGRLMTEDDEYLVAISF